MIMASMFFMSTAPRPHSMPSRISPPNGSTRPVRGVGRDDVEVAVDDEGRLAMRVGALDSRDDARAAGCGVDELRARGPASR